MNSQTEKTMRRKFLGQFIVADPKICHGKPTFVGTRIMVSQVLRQLGKGMSTEKIVREWRGSITREAIAEAIELANRAFVEHAPEYVLESVPK